MSAHSATTLDEVQMEQSPMTDAKRREEKHEKQLLALAAGVNGNNHGKKGRPFIPRPPGRRFR